MALPPLEESLKRRRAKHTLSLILPLVQKTFDCQFQYEHATIHVSHNQKNSQFGVSVNATLFFSERALACISLREAGNEYNNGLA